ncbi:hypothetical protein OG884_35385 [Streptosporangium sp. NBC_01755]|nr:MULTISPECIES: hypothetical protein [unclassified Streptosporangium]WSA28512.1 hypothetical protein OIE13_11885 [Streptosporangium sp. NBC_01810]WSD00001.1 hypothetical protein OG884_35385 [Streptosporangium sp. NBC_01755]
MADWRATHPDGVYTYRDLVADPVPPIDEDRVHLATQRSSRSRMA